MTSMRRNPCFYCKFSELHIEQDDTRIMYCNFIGDIIPQYINCPVFRNGGVNLPNGYDADDFPEEDPIDITEDDWLPNGVEDIAETLSEVNARRTTPIPRPFDVNVDNMRENCDKHWQDKANPESSEYYVRLCDGNYGRLVDSKEFPRRIQGSDIITMWEQLTGLTEPPTMISKYDLNWMREQVKQSVPENEGNKKHTAINSSRFADIL